MNKEIIELILSSKELTNDQKVEIIKVIVKDNSYPAYYPYTPIPYMPSQDMDPTWKVTVENLASYMVTE